MEIAELSSVRPEPADFSGTKLIEVLEALVGPFESHVRAEIKTIVGMATHPNRPREGSAEEKRAMTVFDN
jgi:hypothetical protein